MKAFALMGYPLEPKSVDIVRIEPKDRRTAIMCVTSDGIRIPAGMVYHKKPRRKKVSDSYGVITVWNGRTVEDLAYTTSNRIL